MSEQAKLTYLQEKLREANSHKRWGWSFALLGAAFFAVYSSIGSRQGYISSATIGWLVPAIVLVLSGFVEFKLGDRGKAGVMREMEKMATKLLSCPKCGKPLPQGSFAFCPFCGAPLASSI